MDVNARSYKLLASVQGALQCPCYRTRHGEPICMQNTLFPDATGHCLGCPKRNDPLSVFFREHHAEIREDYDGQNPHR